MSGENQIRLIGFAPKSTVLIDDAMEKLKDGGFELLTNLVMHEYSNYRGFRLAAGSAIENAANSQSVEGIKVENDNDKEGDDADHRRLLLESQRQLMALRAREGRENQTVYQESEAATDEEELMIMRNMNATKNAITDENICASIALESAVNKGEFGSLILYDSILVTILNRLAQLEVDTSV